MKKDIGGKSGRIEKFYYYNKKTIFSSPPSPANIIETAHIKKTHMSFHAYWRKSDLVFQTGGYDMKKFLQQPASPPILNSTRYYTRVEELLETNAATGGCRALATFFRY